MGQAGERNNYFTMKHKGCNQGTCFRCDEIGTVIGVFGASIMLVVAMIILFLIK